jgi:NAD(P)-dependent dehydrogenase (short-subunit alcohol dehydrogenase family)
MATDGPDGVALAGGARVSCAAVAGEDLTGRVVVLTGASAGIGAAAAVALGRLGATVVAVGRDRERLAAVARQVREAGGTAPEPQTADFASLSEVRDLAQRLLAAHERIHVLVNNAGTVATRRELTVDGHGRTFAVNHLAPFLLTNLLLDRLRASAPARVVVTASSEHHRGRLAIETLAEDERRWPTLAAYRNSKLANVLFTRELARRLAGSGVVANAQHPGGVRTRLGRDLPLPMRLGWKFVSRSFTTPQEGAETLVHLAASETAGGYTGSYLARCRPARISRQAQDDALASALWRWSAAAVGIADGG